MGRPVVCVECGRPLNRDGGSRWRFTCSDRCRKRFDRRKASIPAVLRECDRWVRADGKRPLGLDGRPAKVNDPSTWSSFAGVMRSSAGDGFGIMLGGGLACWDLDHCVERRHVVGPAKDVLAGIDGVLYCERSVSGTGLHVFVESYDMSFRRPGVEFYSHDRFIRMTGRRFMV